MRFDDPLATTFLLVETLKSTGDPVWAVKWRSADGTRLRRRLGARAWVVRDDAGRWRPRDGRPAPGCITEFQARRRVAAFVDGRPHEHLPFRMPVRPITFKVNLMSGRAVASTTTTLPAQADVSSHAPSSRGAS